MAVIFRFFIFLGGLLAAFAAHSADGQPAIQLTFAKNTESQILLEARRAPLNQIINAIADKTGAIFHFSYLPVTPVTATCAGRTLRQVLDCLVASQVGIVEHKAATNKPAEFWLLASSLGACQAADPKRAAQIVSDGQTGLEAVSDNQASDDNASSTNQEKSDKLLEQLKNATTVEQQVETLTSLAVDGNINDPKVKAALDVAAHNGNPDVRGQAISALANLDKEGASDYLTQALHDDDASVRLIALDHADEDVDILKQALADSDSTIREFAESKLESIGKRAQNSTIR